MQASLSWITAILSMTDWPTSICHSSQEVDTYLFLFQIPFLLEFTLFHVILMGLSIQRHHQREKHVAYAGQQDFVLTLTSMFEDEHVTQVWPVRILFKHCWTVACSRRDRGQTLFPPLRILGDTWDSLHDCLLDLKWNATLLTLQDKGI